MAKGILAAAALVVSIGSAGADEKDAILISPGDLGMLIGFTLNGCSSKATAEVYKAALTESDIAGHIPLGIAALIESSYSEELSLDESENSPPETLVTIVKKSWERSERWSDIENDRYWCHSEVIEIFEKYRD